MNYDVIVVGGGMSGLMCAYELSRKNQDMQILIIERGKHLKNRSCPASATKKCCACNVCSISVGLGGAGSFSDAKFILSTNYGGELGTELNKDTAQELIDQVDDILVQFGATQDKFYEDEELKLKCLQNNLYMIGSTLKHLGTDQNYKTMLKLITHLEEQQSVEIRTLTVVNDVAREGDGYQVHTADGETFKAKNVVVGTGRSSGNFVVELCNRFNVPIKSNKVDIGVRVEMKDIIWREFSSRIYEPKITYRTPTFNDKTRMFCFCQGATVTAENNGGVITANGKSSVNLAEKTENCNFAILSSIEFTEPFHNPVEYVENISRLSNLIGDGNVIVQRFGDLTNGRRSTEKKIRENSVVPTLAATAGDISLVLPYRVLKNIIETMYALDSVAKGTANPDTLLYACESKYYSVRPAFIGDHFEILPGLYVMGDCSGVTRSLSHAGAMGLYVAHHVLQS